VFNKGERKMKKIHQLLCLHVIFLCGITSAYAAQQNDKLLDYFKTLNLSLKGNIVQKDSINFAGIGSGDGYLEFTNKLCKFADSSNTVSKITISGGLARQKFQIADFCTRRPSIIPKYPEDDLLRNSWEVLYSNTDYNAKRDSNRMVNNERVFFSTTGNTINIHVSSILIEGIQFDLNFKFRKLNNQKALIAMLLEKSTPLTYASYYQEAYKGYGLQREKPAQWNRMVTRYEIAQLDITPRDYQELELKRDEVNDFFIKKYPEKVATVGMDSGSIILPIKKNRANGITYFFETDVHTKKYVKIYDEIKKKSIQGSQSSDF
jgi:hypothetical protein